MTNPSPLTNESLTPSGPETDQSDGRTLLETIKGPAQFLSFWIAIALPFVHVPLLAQGLGDPAVTLTFLALLGVNVLALYVGHGYNQH
ncbi:hypothetical protein [Natrarchaeobaculum aegyptiacum]|uniref:Uncharacterized protein n=1 Tax=Natrarchaeobaculum aegyptiacum TaxID=745377 RepID=A0A2Z2HUI6_9EURY|nr:hypothetical protein [Natrarchaeobaculum aegyptiacum]ARS89805.1 hypothetical protein B1756_08665 [Natrarchaeobaculum aegyptiacum]